MCRWMSVIVGLVVLAIVVQADTAWAKGKKGKGGGSTVPAGYSTVQSVDTTAKTFKLANDEKTYKFRDTTENKNLIYTGSVIKVVVKQGSADDVTSVAGPPVKEKRGKKKNK